MNAICLIAVFLILAICSVVKGAGKPIEIGNYHQMFIDDHLIAKTDNITRRLRPVDKHPDNPVVRADRPWERNLATAQGSVIYDDEDKVYKMWYTTNVQERGKGASYNKGKSFAYAISDDGVRWKKPELDIVRDGGRKTNMLIGPMDAEFGHMYQPYFVIKDAKASDPGRRYKMAFLSIQRNVTEHESPLYPGTRRGMGIAFSPDGLRWTKALDYASEDIIDVAHFMINPLDENEFVVYGRTLYVSPEIKSAWKDYDWYDKVYNGRAVIRTTSRDFLRWEPAKFVMGADLKDPPSSMIYSMNVFPYEGLYIGLAQRYISRLDISTVDIQLAISRDGINFERPFREPFFPLGEVGAWDRFILYNMSSPPLVHGDKLQFYYAGESHRHSPSKLKDTKHGGGIGLATILRDRFVSVEASFDGGTLTTKPLILDGAGFYVNCNVAFGKLNVRLLDASGTPIPGYETSAEGVDAIDHKLEFGKPLSALRSKPVRVEFSLYNVQLYSFYVR